MKLHELHLKHVPFDDVEYSDYIYNHLGFANIFVTRSFE